MRAVCCGKKVERQRLEEVTRRRRQHSKFTLGCALFLMKLVKKSRTPLAVRATGVDGAAVVAEVLAVRVREVEESRDTRAARGSFLGDF